MCNLLNVHSANMQKLHRYAGWAQVQFFTLLSVCGFRSLVEVESTYWGRVVKLFNTQNKLMDVHQSDISKKLPSSTSNLVTFIFIKSHHFTEAYLILLHKTSHTSCVLFFFWFPRASSRERAHLLFLRGKIVRGITTKLPPDPMIIHETFGRWSFALCASSC